MRGAMILKILRYDVCYCGSFPTHARVQEAYPDSDPGS
jgi:hypothetical protein